MYPVYSYMDPCPLPYYYQRNCVPYPLHCYPGWEAMTRQMKIDPSESPVNCKPCPNTSCFGYSNPTESQGCCNHSNPPGFYSFRPPHSHPQPPPAVYYHGPYPSYPEAFPAYFIPPHHLLEQAGYKYAKNMGREHCCRCPNHSLIDKAESNVQIEEEKPEEKPDVEHKDKDNGSTGMMKGQYHPYPTIWFPPSYMKNKESSKQSEPSDPKSWNGWVPLDLNGVRPFMNQHGEDKMHFPFPVIWMPGHDNPKEIEKKDVKGINVSPNNPEEPPKFRIIPVKLLENGDYGEKPGVAEEVDRGADSSLASKEETTKANTVIPKQVKESRDKDSETASKSIPVKQVEENREKRPLEESREKLPSVKNGRKAFKLPPVCLRVDPLPKNKNVNGTSRSPSPPSLKDRLQKDSKSKEPVQLKVVGGESEKKDQSPANKAEQPSRIKEVVQDVASKGESKKNKIKVIKVQDKENQEVEELSKGKDMKAIEIDDNKMVLSSEAKQEVPAEKEAGVEVEKKIITESKKGGPNYAVQVQVQLGAHANSAGVASERSNIKTVEIRGRKKELSSTDAAVLIQAAYRGFEVSKRELVKKMKQIAKVHDQMADIKERIKELEASGDLQQYEKQRLIIGETIMSLLLQLDTIQGLHPSVREARKSVAKELVCLQEKLDSLPAQKTGRSMTTVPESVPLQKVLGDCPEAFEDASLSAVTQAKTAASLNLTMTGKATSEEEAVKQTAVGKIQLHENEHAETELSLVQDEGLKTRHELSVDHSPPSEDRMSSSESELLLEDPAVGNGSLDAATVLVESLPSTDQEQRFVPPESIVLEVETKTDSEADGSIGLMRDEACVSAVEKQAGVPSNQKDEEPSSEPVLVEEAQKDEEPAPVEKFTEVQSADDITAEPHFDLPEGSEDLNPLQKCKQTSLAKDSNEDSVTVAPVEPSEREGEPELGIRELLAAAEPAEKDEEHKCMADVEMEIPSPESLAEATENDVSELPPEMNVKAESDLDLPILSEITIGFNSAADEHAQNPEIGGSDAVAPIKDVDKLVYEGSKMVELETPVIETENATVAESVLDKLLETEVAEKEAAEAENKPASAAMKVILELGGTDQPPDGLEFSEGIATVVESPVSEPSAASVTTQLLSPGSETLKALETQDGCLSLEAAGAPTVDAGTHCLEVTNAVSGIPSSAETWKGSTASDDVELRKEDEKAMGRTEDLKEMLEKLIEAGKQQLTVISDLNERVRDLEKQLAQKKKLKGKKRSVAVRPWCMKNVDPRLNGRPAATAV